MFVARALLGRPQLLLMDEPTSGVDFRTRHEILHLLGDLHGDGLAIVLTTHDLNGIAAHLPHLVCLNTEIIGTGPPRTVLTPDILERTFGAPIEVLEHAGMPVVVDSHRHVGADVIEFPGISALAARVAWQLTGISNRAASSPTNSSSSATASSLPRSPERCAASSVCSWCSRE